jgi:putative transposase
MRVIKVKLYPKPAKEKKLHLTFEASRRMWNDLLTINKERYKQEKKFVFFYGMEREITKLRRSINLYRTVPLRPLQGVAKQLDLAIRQFLKRRKEGFGFPKYKRQGEYPILIFPDVFKLSDGGYVYLSKIGWIRIKDRITKSEKWKIICKNAKQVWVKKEVDGYYAHIVYENEETSVSIPHKKKIVGVDVGIEKTITLSDGRVYTLPKDKIAKLVKTAEHLQSIIDRKINANKKLSIKHSNKVERLKQKQRKILKKIDNIRTDFYYKVANEICKEYKYIAVEDLNLAEMIHSRKHSGSKSIHKWLGNVSLSKFFKILEWVAIKNGCQVIYVNPKNTSKTCSHCGYINENLKLSDRRFVCPNCGLEIDRDLNASLNIMREGLRVIHKPSSVGPTEYTPVKSLEEVIAYATS